MPSTEITDDWRRLPVDELEKRSYLAHMDSLGFRYYIPAFVVSALEENAQYSGRWCSIITCLYPKEDQLWEHCMMHYALLSEAQKSAIAKFLVWVRDDGLFDGEDKTMAEGALRNYWSQFLHKE